MHTPICDRLGCELPIFAFTHCRDVVVEITKAGGFGVLGCAAHSPEELEQELHWIDTHVPGRPYGIDVLIPVNYDREAEQAPVSLSQLVPAEQRQFVEDFLAREGVPQLPTDLREEWQTRFDARSRNNTQSGARKLIDVGLRHPSMKFVVSALGEPPADIVDMLHARGVLVGALCGKAEHVSRHRAAGVDVLIAQGTEAGGHTGQISTMVLVPQVVEAAGGEMAVLAAGGISRGSQIAAALALGAQGAWCGSVWLATRESELEPLERQVLYAARTEDAVQRKWQTGKSVRLVRSKLSEVWERPGAPSHLPAPLQGALYHESKARILRAGRADLLSFPVGQLVGTLNHETSVREVVHAMLQEYAQTLERLAELHRSLQD